ncbi:MAG TPA: hypothetical protein P5230_03395 [Candidatus Magasanikbacteria bacterium]|nr:hypothetical protein [Candidatus Magasanikbacteria bacterium]
MQNEYEKYKPQNEMAENKEVSPEVNKDKEISPEQATELIQQQVVETINIGETTLNTTMKKMEATPEEIAQANKDLSEINNEIADLGETTTQEITESTESSSEKYDILPDESPEHYIYRISKPVEVNKLTKGKGREKRFLQKLNEEELQQIIKNISEKTDTDKKFDKEKNLKNLAKIYLDVYSAGNFSDPNRERNAQSFSETDQGRSFFYTRTIGGDNIPYSESLFSLPINTEEHPSVKEYYKKLLDNKNILLLGGGDSIEDLLKDPDIKPNKIINADPFLKKESFDKNPQSNYYNLDKKADDPALPDYFAEQNIKADEIWASYSVPLYLKDAKEITNLFANIKNVLAENGTCRIYPLSTTFNENLEEMNKALKDSLKEMIDTGEFNIEKTGQLLTIVKIKKDNLEKNTEIPPTIDKKENTVISMTDLKNIATQTGETILYHGGLPDNISMDSIDLNKTDSKQNKKGKTYGGFYLSDETSKNWSEQYAKTGSNNVHGFLVDKGSRVLEITDRDIDRLSQEKRDELAKEYDLVKGKDLLGRTQFVLLNKDIIKGLGVEKIED